MTTTAHNITPAQISALRTESYEANDHLMGAICDLALNGTIDTDDYTVLSREEAAKVRGMSSEEAVRECARVIVDAEAAS